MPAVSSPATPGAREPLRTGRRRRSPHRAAPALVLGAALTLSACGSVSEHPAGQPTPGAHQTSAQGTGSGTDVVAVATTTQLGSVLEQITRCAGTEAVSVMGPGDDPHDFAPSSAQIAQMTQVPVVFANGLGLEIGMQTALENAAADGATVVEVGPELDPLPFAGEDGHDHAGTEHAETAHDHGEHEHEHEEHAEEDHAEHDLAGHDHGPLDPHVWMDAGRLATAAEFMGQTLAEELEDPEYTRCGAQAAAQLQSLDEELHALLDQIPQERRTVVTDHAAYGYFAQAYGFETAAVVVSGGGTDAEPSSAELAELIRDVQDSGADALLTSQGGGARLVQTVAEEAGGLPVVPMYESGVGPEDSGASTYAEAMCANARALVEALG